MTASTSATGIIFDIKKFAIHDGPGIRTTVFLKGCPLSCLWCHNPESQEKTTEVFFTPEKCIGCGYCAKVCPQNAHVFTESSHTIDRSLCQRCGQCATQCYAQAIELAGKEITVQAALDEVLKDKPFYETSNGGMTLSGGEPMMQFPFTRDLLHAAKAAKLHNCLDTCGHASFDKYQQILPDVDLFLYDLKETDPARHRDYTGVDNQLILENLTKLDQAGAAIILRCPVIPGLNDRTDHFIQIGQIADKLNNLQEITVHPYHPLGKSKNQRLGKDYALDTLTFPEEQTVQSWLDTIQSHTKFPVKRS